MRPFVLGVTIAIATASIATAALLVRKPTKESGALPSTPPSQAPSADATTESEPGPSVSPSASASASEDAPAIDAAPPARRAGPIVPLEDVVCNDPNQKYGSLCISLHPDCYCIRNDAVWSGDVCDVPFDGGRCPTGYPTLKISPSSKQGGPCKLYFSRDGKEWTSNGVASCTYCNMADWYNEPRRKGVVGAPCTGINHLGATVTGRYVRLRD